MKPFLKQVAEVYCVNERDNLLDYCFVFPNKRSSVFFARYLEQAMAGHQFIMPQLISMSDFVASFSDKVEATRYQQLFTLYNCYDRLSGDIADFDRFHFWGEMLLSDFNDVDSYMVDAGQLFVNVSRLKEINSNYFTPEQLDIIKRYWGEVPQGFDPEEFWRHVGADGKGSTGERFRKLWEILYPLYTDFHQSLEKDGLTNRGRLYRNAAAQVSRRESFAYSRYIFVGFNVLSTSEVAIFERLKARGMADFYWDVSSPAFEIKGNRASRFMAGNIRMFSSRYNLEEEAVETFPKIDIVGVPSRVGQAKYAAEVLEKWIDTGVVSNPGNAVDTAVVLPDEYLFVPLIHSLPASLGSVNITMGYPMKHTPVASLVKTVVSMHLNARIVKGEMRYFYEDILKVVTHPLVISIGGSEAAGIADKLVQKRLFTISAGELIEMAPSLKDIFAAVEDVKDFAGVYSYTDSMLSLLSQAINDSMPVDRMFIESYRSSLMALKEAVEYYKIKMRESTFFQLLERAVAGDSVRFVGEPLDGLQIMGVLETRSLDFDNIIIMSMNERIFPRKHYSRSFIPETLRRAYGLSTTDFQESIYAYLFFRLISRARNVTLLYDARNIGGKSSEMSRYLAQLLYIYNKGNVNHQMYNYLQQAFTPPLIEVNKSGRVLEKLRQYTIPMSGKNLSASSINDYINCPLNFYLKYVEGYNPDNEPVDYMDSSTYGTVLHEVAENLYRSKLPDGEPIPEGGVVITAEDLNRLIESPVIIDTLITKSVNRHFYKREDDDTTPLRGEPEILARVMKMFVKEMLRREKAFTPFTFIAAEYKIETHMKVSDRLSVNIKQYIDRVDRVNIDRDSGLLRLVDYKTGGDMLRAPGMDSLFNPVLDNRCKAMLQLFFYCNAYTGFTEPDYPVQPLIYSFRNMKKEGIVPLKIGGEEIKDFRKFNQEFNNRFKAVIEEIFDPEVPFRQAQTAHACTFCNFKQICSRLDEK